MRNNKGMGIISLICIVFVITIIVGISVYFIRIKYNEAKVQTMKTDMLLVEWKVKSYIDKQTAEKVSEINYLGEKVSDKKDDEIIKKFLDKKILAEDELHKYYVLNDEDLAEANLEITNREENYFLINYENYEVIITGGCKISEGKVLYKLSELEKEINESEENVENIQINEVLEGEE